MDEQQAREQRGLVIVATAKLQKSDDGYRWFVPSQTQGCHNTYTVKPDPARPHCTCPDFESRKLPCKHIFAVEYTIQREETSDGKTVVTETLKISQKTYSQDWSSYNKAQTQEKEYFQRLLHLLCKGIGEPTQQTGRPRLPLPDMIFSAAFKVYSTVSARRFMCDLLMRMRRVTFRVCLPITESSNTLKVRS
jgi:predicted nucleic acid-binding Zn finger protein